MKNGVRNMWWWDWEIFVIRKVWFDIYIFICYDEYFFYIIFDVDGMFVGYGSIVLEFFFVFFKVGKVYDYKKVWVIYD